MKKRKLNVSGYRGIWGDTLTDKIVKDYAKAFAKFTKEDTEKDNPTILVGRDGRETGGRIRDIIIRELKKEEVNAIDGDILPTPTMLFSVRNHKYDGGIIITASHNPIQYNGLKFINKDALFTIEDQITKIQNFYEKFDKEDDKEDDKTNKNLDNKEIVPNFPQEHVDKILAHVDVKAIRAKKFKVAADMINASACVIDPYLFKKLGVDLVPLNNIPNGKFAHNPEPLKENLSEIGKLVKESGANLGFVHDPDADRLVIVNENGEVILEEYSVVIAIENILSKHPGKPIVLNLSTSQMGADVAARHDSPCFRTKVGEPNVVEGIIKHEAIAGGEGNGGIIYPTINTVRDSFTGIALVLELLAERNETITECISKFPKYFMKKEKWPIEDKDIEEIKTEIKNAFPEAKTDEQDGIRLDFPDRAWMHLHPSNTQPIVRLFGEAKTQEDIDRLFKIVEGFIL